jgi:hypothetical protein
VYFQIRQEQVHQNNDGELQYCIYTSLIHKKLLRRSARKAVDHKKSPAAIGHRFIFFSLLSYRRVSRQFNGVSKRFGPTKNKRVRFVPCNQNLRKELTSWIKQIGRPGDEPIFQSSTGTPISQNNFARRVFAQDLKESGVKRIRFHDLRHTATTLMIASGLDLKTVQEICGHQKITTTMNYTHLLGDSIRKAARSFSIGTEHFGEESSDQITSEQPALRLVE